MNSPRLIHIFVLLTVCCIGCSCTHQENAEEVDPRYKIKIREDRQSPTGHYIPKDLSECHAELDRMLHPDAKAFFAGHADLSAEDRKTFERSFDHMGLGMWIRNNWGLWKRSRLASYFYEMGIQHPDDMSAIILNSYRAKSQGRTYDLQSAIRFFQKYWAQMGQPPPFVDPGSGSKIVIPKEKTRYFTGKSVVHVGMNEATGEKWFYQLERGWYKPSLEEAVKIEHSSINIVHYGIDDKKAKP